MFDPSPDNRTPPASQNLATHPPTSVQYLDIQTQSVSAQLDALIEKIRAEHEETQTRFEAQRRGDGNPSGGNTRPPAVQAPDAPITQRLRRLQDKTYALEELGYQDPEIAVAELTTGPTCDYCRLLAPSARHLYESCAPTRPDGSCFTCYTKNRPCRYDPIYKLAGARPRKCVQCVQVCTFSRWKPINKTTHSKPSGGFLRTLSALNLLRFLHPQYLRHYHSWSVPHYFELTMLMIR